MEDLFPSEIARLVLGYLKENKCEKSWKTFLDESSDLQEYYQLYKKGKYYSTNVNGKSLYNILSEYCALRRGNVNNSYSSKLLTRSFKEKCKAALEEIVTNAVEVVLKKYLHCSCYSNHLKDKFSADVALEIQDSEFVAGVSIDHESEAEKSNNRNEVLALEDKSIEVRPPSPESNMETNVADSSTNLPDEQSMDQDANITESSGSDFIYLHDIIKVEKEDFNTSYEYSLINASEISSSQDGHAVNSKCATNQNLNENTNALNRDCVVTNSTCINIEKSTHKSVEPNSESVNVKLEVLDESIKLEPGTSAPCNTTDNNSVKNNSSTSQIDTSSTLKVNQTVIRGNTTSTSSIMDNLGNSILNNQSGYVQQTLPLPSQSVTVDGASISSIPTYIMPNYASAGQFLQNNSPYRVIINTPAVWPGPTANGLPLNVANNPSIGPVLASVGSVKKIDTQSLPKISTGNEINLPTGDVRKIVSNSTLTASVPDNGQSQIKSKITSNSSRCRNNVSNVAQNCNVSDNATLGIGKKSVKGKSNSKGVRVRELFQNTEPDNTDQKTNPKSKEKRTRKQKAKRKLSDYYNSSTEETAKKPCAKLPYYTCLTETVKKPGVTYGSNKPVPPLKITISKGC